MEHRGLLGGGGWAKAVVDCSGHGVAELKGSYRIPDSLQAVQIALRVQERSGPKMDAFVEEIESDADVRALRERVVNFSEGLFMP